MHLNTTITHEGRQYEVYWTTAGARHVLENYVADQPSGPHYGLDHTNIVKLLKRARYIVPLLDDPRPFLHVCLTGYRSKVYETYVYLVPELDNRPPRCVIVTSYASNKQKYRELFTA